MSVVKAADKACPTGRGAACSVMLAPLCGMLYFDDAVFQQCRISQTAKGSRLVCYGLVDYSLIEYSSVDYIPQPDLSFHQNQPDDHLYDVA